MTRRFLAEKAARRAKELAYRAAAVRMYSNDAVHVDSETLARVRVASDGSGAWVTASVWVPVTVDELIGFSETVQS